jgi:hypothetical protein
MYEQMFINQLLCTEGMLYFTCLLQLVQQQITAFYHDLNVNFLLFNVLTQSELQTDFLAKFLSILSTTKI